MAELIVATKAFGFKVADNYEEAAELYKFIEREETLHIQLQR